MKIKLYLLSLGILMFSINTPAELISQKVEYKSGTTLMEGVLAYDKSVKGKKTAILIVHDWMGLSAFTENKAEELAKLGYISFAVDIYGKGVRPKDAKEASQLAGLYKGDRRLLKEHIKAAYDKLLGLEHVDKSRVVVIGYCFGGTTALELARSGVPLAGTVSFHGGLDTPAPDEAQNIKGKVLILHGADDPFVPLKDVTAFKESMDKAKVAYQFIAYPGAVHSFTNPQAGTDNSKGAAYNKKADEQSWKEFMSFLKTLNKK